MKYTGCSSFNPRPRLTAQYYAVGYGALKKIHKTIVIVYEWDGLTIRTSGNP